MARKGRPEKDSQERTARKGQPRKDSQKRTAKKGQPARDSENRTGGKKTSVTGLAGQGSQHRAVSTGLLDCQQGQNRKQRTVRKCS